MRKRIGVGTIAMLWLGMGATGAQATEAAARQCVTSAEAGGLILALAPDAVTAVGKACTGALPPAALIRQTDGPFLQKYRAEADRTGPMADAAIIKIAGVRDKAALKELGSRGLRQMMSAILMPKLAAGIKPRDCLVVERIVSSLEPLPPQNMADLLVTILQATNADKVRKGEKVDVDICPMGEP